MSWILLAIVAIGTFLYVAAPLYAPATEVAKDTADIEAYRLEIEAIDAEDDPSDEAVLRKTYLQRQMLTMTQHTAKAHVSTQAKPWMAAIAALLLLGSAGLYSQIGRPDLVGTLPVAQAPIAPLTPTQTNPDQPQDMAVLVQQLGDRLRAGQGDATGWRLYARSLMTLGRYAEVEAAYDKALSMSDNDAEIADEKASALAYITEQATAGRTGIAPPNAPTSATPPGPTQDDIAAAQDMEAGDRQAMIQGMVDGLSERLMDEPNDADAWVRLLRARGVLGQNDKAVAEIALMEKAFADQPDIINDILTQSGWVATTSPTE